MSHDEGNVLQGLTAMLHGKPVGKAITSLGLVYGKPKEDVVKSIPERDNIFCLEFIFSVSQL